MKFLKICSNVFNSKEAVDIMNKKGLLGTLIFVVVLLVIGFFWFVANYNSGEILSEECVLASCCHSDSCVLASEAPDCNSTLCTMDCRPETMDCGQGHCEFIDGNCEVIWDE